MFVGILTSFRTHFGLPGYPLPFIVIPASYATIANAIMPTATLSQQIRAAKNQLQKFKERGPAQYLHCYLESGSRKLKKNCLTLDQENTWSTRPLLKEK